ncbi:MAG: nucleotidyl transferase AbiEii/AbiGii toxin family protein [Microbacterium sp.]|jgi:hypothetical protein|uniref:nucleotidyl transferase AbiEii/AbiGii toxin family protein n=1 Tax=Microbacterium sp. TaxID=51671 RepID=UPI00281A8EA8|nr:nucleotidyl transferase AbiEii/AbiGii toxin family protein [Microbacterium sp.]MDR2321072.1 nucleotidyl transferase AbiEii/AbiGii toxin family protein [Microbacterium sp.]
MATITKDELGRLQLLVDSLGHDLEPSILIGGWATQLRVGGEVSKDIDLIINDPSLRTKLREVLDDYTENGHHSGGRKGRGTANGVHVDAYIPYESMLGDRLRLKVDVLSQHVEPERVKGWLMLTLEAHLATKFAALLDRADSEKGHKDAREIVRLFELGPSAADTVKVLREATATDPDTIQQHVSDVFDLVPDRAMLNKQARRTFAQLKRQWVEEAARQGAGTPGTVQIQMPFLAQGRQPKGAPGSTGGQFSRKAATPPAEGLRRTD